MASFVNLRRPSARKTVPTPTPVQNSRRTAKTYDQQRESKYLDNEFWRPYRNNDKLSHQVYQLTHLDYLAVAEQELALKWPTF